MNVLHLPTHTGGNAWTLAQGEKSLGISSKVLYTTSNRYRYKSDISIDLRRDSTRYARLLCLLEIFGQIRNKYDVFHFNFGQSLICIPSLRLSHLDLPFYPKSARLFVTYNGTDARQKLKTTHGTVISQRQNYDIYEGLTNARRSDQYKAAGIRKMARHVEHIWALNPDLLYFLPKNKSSFLPYAVEPEKCESLIPDFSKRKLKIIHAPTNRTFKGTQYVLNAIGNLKKSHGHLFEFKIVENLPHDRALRIFQTADLIIDQLMAGWYGAFAIEVMAMGKPVICRIEENDLHFVPEQMGREVLEAFINAGPDNIQEILTNCIEDRQLLLVKAKAGADYARKWHEPKSVAHITKQAYEGNYIHEN